MSKINFYSFALVITSQSQIISLPVKKNISVSRMRIKSVSYNTASTGNKFILINIRGFNENSIYYDGYSVIPYTKFLLLPPSINTPILYTNTQNDSFDVIKNDEQSELTNFTIDSLINNSVTISNDISPSNPLFIEIYVEGKAPENQFREIQQ